MRSAYIRIAFTALDKLIDDHYIHSMTREIEMTLAQHLAALNAEKLAWVAEDPANRWTGLYVEELDFWAEQGIYTVAQFKRHENETLFWEMYKDVTGFRPRHINVSEMSDEQLEKELDYLGSQMDRAIAEQEEYLAEIEAEEAEYKAKREAWLAEQPEAIDYVACHYQEGWL